MTHVEPPRQVDDPRPPVETLRKWPFVLGGCAAVAVLGAVTIGPSFLAGEPEVRAAEPDPRMTQPRPLHGMPLNYSQVQQPPAPEPAPAPLPEPEPVVQQAPAPAVRYGGGPTGPTKADLLKAARMADLKPVPVTAAGYVGEEEGAASGGSSTLR